MEQFNEFISSITSLEILDIIIAIGIVIVFRIFSSTIAYAIIRMFKLKTKKAKDIRESAFYSPLKVFFIILGIYLAVLFLKKPLNLSQEVMGYVRIAFGIMSVIALAKGLEDGIFAGGDGDHKTPSIKRRAGLSKESSCSVSQKNNYFARAFLALSHRAAKASALWTAMSARTLRLRSMLATFSPCISLL